MKYLYTDRYVGNRRSNRDDEFVGNGETERGREGSFGGAFLQIREAEISLAGKRRIRWCVRIYRGVQR